jgi:alanyl-tRNA synthetase
MKDNFWQMGETGPCGPSSEIHVDMGVEASDKEHPECAAGKCQFPCPHDCGRYMEIWNLVFMQFDRVAQANSDGSVTYVLNPLPRPSIDTGMGLERIAAVLQGVDSNYDTDLFTPLIARAAELTGVNVQKEKQKEDSQKSAASLRVIADHSRAATFLISDGVLPSNEGRGYVLRKILRRGIRHGRLLGQEKPFMHEMVYAVRDLMKDAYPELVDSADRVAKVVHTEEARFAHTLNIGLARLEEMIGEAKGGVLNGADAFQLYDTFGLPLDFIVDAARDAGLQFDQAAFDSAMQEQREKARASWKGGTKAAASPVYRELDKTVFEGYHQTESRNCEIIALVRNGAGVRELRAGEEGDAVLDHTPFYADSGGQVGDVGWFKDSSGNILAEVHGCVMPVQGVRAHKIVAKQPLHVGMRLDAIVDAHTRAAIVRNHTGTHLLHAALRETLGGHVKQAGSLVEPARLRFDFSHFTAVADEELQDIEELANREVLRNTRVQVFEDVPIDVAINEMKAMALFGEKYGERVRVIKIGDFSTELCGGIHTGATGEIGLLKLTTESSVSSGVRRVEAITGEKSLEEFRRAEAAEQFKRELHHREEELKKLRKELEQLRMKSAAASVSSATEKVSDVNGIKVLAQRVDNIDRGQMRTLVDNLRNKLGSGVVVLGSISEVDGEKKVALICGVTKDLTPRVQAGKIIGSVAKKVGGSGGGRPDMAEAGGKDPSALDAALAEVPEVVRAATG